MAALEERAVHYLFKLRLTKNVKRYIERLFGSGLARCRARLGRPGGDD